MHIPGLAREKCRKLLALCIISFVMQAGNRIPNYAETKAYVPSVLTHYDRYKTNSGSQIR